MRNPATRSNSLTLFEAKTKPSERAWPAINHPIERRWSILIKFNFSADIANSGPELDKTGIKMPKGKDSLTFSSALFGCASPLYFPQ